MDNYEQVKMLLNQQDDLLITEKSSGNNLLMLAKSVNVCKLLLDEAINRNIVSSLLLMKNNMRQNIIDYYISLAQLNLIITLEDFLCFFDPDDIRNSLAYSRNRSWMNPESKHIFDEICHILRPYSLKIKGMENFEKEALRYNKNIANKYLYGLNTLEELTPMQHTVTETYTLLNNPVRCIKYLQRMENEFAGFCKINGYELAELPSKQYYFETLNGLHYPVPKKKFKGIKKNHLLQRFLIDLFKKHGMAQNSFKWVGAIPEHISLLQFGRGDFLQEFSDINGGWAHGSLSHMIQQALIIYAVAEKEIPLSDKFSIIDLLKATTLPSSVTPFPLRATIFDMRVLDKISFSDPHRLYSCFMFFKDLFKTPLIANCLIDSCCKALQWNLKIYQNTVNADISMAEFIEEVKDTKLEIFGSPSIFREPALEKEVKKNRLGFFDKQKILNMPNPYAIIEMNY